MTASGQVEEPLTLNSVFGAGLKKQIAEGVKGRRKKKSALAWFRRFLWMLVAPWVNAKVNEVLDIPLGDTLGGAYVTLGEVKKAAQEVEKGVETALKKGELKLDFGHLITLEMDHAIVVDAAKYRVGRLEFDIELNLRLENATVGIVDGCLTHVKPGACKVTGTFKYTIDAYDPGPFPLPPAKLDLPGLIAFEPPVRVLPAALAPVPENEAPQGDDTYVDKHGRRGRSRRLQEERRQVVDAHVPDRRQNKRRSGERRDRAETQVASD